MTEKRFKIGDDTECPIIEGKFELNREEVVELLNKQNEYLNILREELELVYEQNTSLEKENKQLKLQNKQYSMMVNANSDLNDEIYGQLQKTEKALKRVCEENEQLKKENKEFKEERKGFESCSHNWGILYNEAKNKVEELSKENERLKFQLKECKNNKLFSRRELERENKEFKEENEQLKKTIKGVYEILSIDVDVFSDKATEHDINAYIELKELDNKDAYYIAKSTKKAIKLLKKVMIE